MGRVSVRSASSSTNTQESRDPRLRPSGSHVNRITLSRKHNESNTLGAFLQKACEKRSSAAEGEEGLFWGDDPGCSAQMFSGFGLSPLDEEDVLASPGGAPAGDF